MHHKASHFAFFLSFGRGGSIDATRRMPRGRCDGASAPPLRTTDPHTHRRASSLTRVVTKDRMQIHGRSCSFYKQELSNNCISEISATIPAELWTNLHARPTGNEPIKTQANISASATQVKNATLLPQAGYRCTNAWNRSRQCTTNASSWA